MKDEGLGYNGEDFPDNNIEEDIEEEKCGNCIYCNQSGYCSVKNTYINKKSHNLCWSYKNFYTLKTISDFQNDNDDFDYDD